MNLLYTLFKIGYGEDGYDKHGYNRDGYNRQGLTLKGMIKMVITNLDTIRMVLTARL